MTFAGFPTAALDFYDDLEVDNTKSFWESHKGVYKEAVEAPMRALMHELEPEFGQAKIYRPYRDVRFAKDKTPYKTHQGALVAVGPALGYYLELSARGVRVGAGFYEATGPRLLAIREAINDDKTGPQLQAMVDAFAADGWEIAGEQLKTAPRGFDKDAPRLDLLRRKQLFVSRPYGFEADAIGPGLVDRVRADWQALRPLVEWFARHGDE